MAKAGKSYHVGLHFMVCAWLLEGPPRTKIGLALDFNVDEDQAGTYINEMVRQKLMVSIGPEPQPAHRRGYMPDRFIPVQKLGPNPLAALDPKL